MNALAQADPDNARIEHDKALSRVMAEVMSDDTELFKQFMDNEGFRRWMQDRVFGQTSERVGKTDWPLPALRLCRLRHHPLLPLAQIATSCRTTG